MKESGNLPPQANLETRASVYKIIPHNYPRESLIRHYNHGEVLKWTLNAERFSIKIWAAVDDYDPLHAQVDGKADRAGTKGYIDKERGIIFSGRREGELDARQKNEITMAIKQYLQPSALSNP